MANNDMSQMNQTASAFLGARQPSWMLASQSTPNVQTNHARAIPSGETARQHTTGNNTAYQRNSQPQNTSPATSARVTAPPVITQLSTQMSPGASRPPTTILPSNESQSRSTERSALSSTYPQMVTSSLGYAAVQVNQSPQQAQHQQPTAVAQFHPIPSYHTNGVDHILQESTRSSGHFAIGSRQNFASPDDGKLWHFINLQLQHFRHTTFTEPTTVFQKRFSSETIASYARTYRQKLNEYGNSLKLTGQNQKSMQTASRLELLRGACSDSLIDEPYLIIHQILCLKNVNPAQVPGCIRSIPNVDASFALLDSLLGFDYNMDSSFFRFGANFPTPFTLEATSPIIFKLQEVLATMNEAYTNILHRCIAEGIPPLLEEFVLYFRVNSPTLQRVLFLSLNRRSGYAKEELDLLEAERIFQLNQQEYNRSDGQHIPKDKFDIYVRSYLALRQKIESRGFTRPQQTSQSLYRAQSSGSTSNAQNSNSPSARRFSGALASTRTPILFRDVNAFSNTRPMPHVRRSSAPIVQHTLTQPTDAYSRSPLSSTPPQGISGENTTNHEVRTSQTARLSFFPPRGVYGAEVAVPEPAYYGAHQAHLQPPTLKLADHLVPSAIEQRRYQYVNDFLVRPTSVPDNLSGDHNFNVSEEVINAKPSDQITSVPGAPAQRILKDSSATHRLRCVQSRPIDELSDWCTRITRWPSDVYFCVNGERLQPRKKLHHGRDLPIDVTRFIREGANIVSVFCNRSQEARNVTYSFAIETVKLVKQDDILNFCHSNTISEADAIASMVKALAPRSSATPGQMVNSANLAPINTSLKQNDNTAVSADSNAMPTSNDTIEPTTANADDSDDVLITSTTLPISLLDPQSQTPCVYPVRGASCRHRANFDLLTFLNTRRSLSCSATEPADPDEWVCPLCRGDVRPPVLVHDGWMGAVLKSLATSGQTGVREVVVDQQGKWSARSESTAPVRPGGSGSFGGGVVKTREGSEGVREDNGEAMDVDMDPAQTATTTSATDGAGGGGLGGLGICGAGIDDAASKVVLGKRPSSVRVVEVIELDD